MSQQTLSRDEMISLAQRQLDAYNKRDLEAFVDCYHPEDKGDISTAKISRRSEIAPPATRAIKRLTITFRKIRISFLVMPATE